MIDLATFKENCGVTKNQYVKKWLEAGLIPGVRTGPSIEDTRFPDAARRPYHDRAKIKPTTNAIDIRTHIVKACISKEHISCKMCYMTPKEFKCVIDDLVGCGLLSIREEDGIEYYDSTAKCDALVNQNFKEVRKFVIEVLGEIAGRITKEIIKKE